MAAVDEPAVPGPVELMCDALRHRGPDDSGLYVAPDHRCVLGNRRLAVLDLSPAGRMPMATEDGRFHLTYNGEVYNFPELRRELESRGHRFRSDTDTEVVLRSLVEWGPRAVTRFNGMFAFALWDAEHRALLLARDRMGIKPLYYALAGNTILFGSEIRAILASGLICRVADTTALSGYLTFGSVPDDRTAVRGVSSLPPAHYCEWRAGRLAFHRYWDHAEELRSAPPLPAEEMVESVRNGLKAAVGRHMFSDAPLGLFLSGGLDSTTIAALMRASGGEDLRAVSIVFDEAGYDESSSARSAAQRFGLQHVETRVGAIDVAAGLDSIIMAMDQPSADAVNSYFVSKAAREAGLTVALSGLGADELFGGYPSFRLVPRVQSVQRTLSRLPGHGRLLPLLARRSRLPYRARKLMSWSAGAATSERAYAAVRGVISPGQQQRVAPRYTSFDFANYVASFGVDGLDSAERTSMWESRLYMHNQLLRDTDAMSMAHSLEVRVPFLDNDVVTLAARARRLLSDGRKSVILGAREIYFPIGTQHHPKRGFSFPFAEWLRGPLSEWTRIALDEFALTAGGDAASIRRDFDAGRIHWSALWTPAVLGRWLSAHGVSLP